MKLMIIDGNSIVNRAFYGVRLLSTHDGTPTNAVYGFLNILLKLIGEEEPEGLCVTFDLKDPTFRHEKYDGYKAQRKAMPDELAVQMPILKEVLDAMNIPRYELAGYEADDLIGTAARITGEKGHTSVVVTGDKDSFQLISETTSVKHVKSRMGQTETKLYDTAAFVEEYGFEPIKMIDLKALMGDSSDNIPGVAGIGEKTAMDLIRRFGTVENIFGNLDTLDIKDSVRRKLASGREAAEMSYDLARIRCDAPIDFSPEANIRRPVDNDKLYSLFKKLEFTRLMERFNVTKPEKEAEPEKAPMPEYTKVWVRSKQQLDDAAGVLKSVGSAAFYGDDDFEELAFASENTVYLIRHSDYDGDWNEALGKLFGSEIKKAGYYIKDIMHRLTARGIACENWISDTALAAYLLDPTANSYGLERLAGAYCGYELDSGDQNAQLSLLEEYDTMQPLAERAEAIASLVPTLEKKLADNGIETVYRDIELPLCRVLADMELEGFLIDRDELKRYGAMLSGGIDALTSEIYELAGEEFNINSPKQLGEVLFEKLMLPAPKKTKTGWSTSIEVLEKLFGKHPIIEKIIDYRQLTKLKSTYADGLLKVIAPDGRIHTKFQMTVTATGRLSSIEPNLQNIPVRRALGGEIRKMFTAGDGNVLVDADYSQIELRLLAHISNDETMRDAFLSGEDIHAVTASQVFGVPLDEVTPLQRSRAKAVNFGIVYGISAFSLAQDIKVSVAEAKRYMDSYLEKYHGVRDHMESVVKEAKDKGYVETLYGRKRYLPELKSSNYNTRSFGERVALNMPIQGTAADIMKIAMINAHKRLKIECPRAKLLLQVHDELLVECPEEDANAAATILKEEMENAASLTVPLTAETGIGKNWYEAK